MTVFLVCLIFCDNWRCFLLFLHCSSAPDLWNSTDKHAATTPVRSTKPANTPPTSLDSPALRSYCCNSSNRVVNVAATNTPTSSPVEPPRSLPLPPEPPVILGQHHHHSHHSDSLTHRHSADKSCPGSPTTLPPPGLVGTYPVSLPPSYPPPPPLPPSPLVTANNKLPKKYILNGWRTSLRSKTRSNTGRFATTIGSTSTGATSTPEELSNAELVALSRRWSESNSPPPPPSQNLVLLE